MKISRVAISKFRSILNATVELNEINAVVGENNAGKTALMRALNAVFNFDLEKDSFLSRAHQYAPRSNSYITLWFCDVPNEGIYEKYVTEGNIKYRLVYEYSKARSRFEIETDAGWNTAPDDLIKQIQNDLVFVYIPAERSSDDISCNEETVFGKVVSNYFIDQFKHRDTVTSNVKQASKKIHDTVLVNIEQQLNRLYMQGIPADFKIGFPDDLDYSVLLGSIQISLNENDATYLMQEWGSGTRSLAIIAMHRANALLRKAHIVLGIEEPETNLHPQAQKRFIMSLKQGLEDKEMQTIFTTHSTVLVDALSHEDIILVRREFDAKRGFHSVLKQIQSDFWETYSLKEEKHYQFFRYRNSDFFFSKFVVVGESKNDCQVFESLISNDLGMETADVSFLNAEGVDCIKYPYFLLKELEIPYAFVVDRDYFFPYFNEELESSRDAVTGLPKYGKAHKTDKKVLPVIEDLFPTEADMQELEIAHQAGYRRLFELLKQKGFLVTNYCPEMDLTCSSAAREEYYRLCKVQNENRNQKELLIEYKKTIKDITKILSVLKSIPKSAYPESYSKIKNSLVEMIVNQTRAEMHQ